MFISLMSAALAFLPGCRDKATFSDESEREHPAMKRARELEDAGDRKTAQFIYQSLLDRDATIARAHLALALLLESEGEDHLSALYHYRRYLLLRPDTEKRAMIEAHMRAEKMKYVGTVFSNETAAVNRLTLLEEENRALRTRVSNLNAQLVQYRRLKSLPLSGIALERPAQVDLRQQPRNSE